MTVMLCRNKVEDFERWKDVFDSHGEAHREAGLKLLNLWRSTDDPDHIFFLLEVESIERADAFINDPASAEAGRQAGVLEGEFHYLENLPLD